MNQNRKPYNAEFRQQMVDLVRAGRKPSELAQEFGCHVSSIHDWLAKAAIPETIQASPLSSAEREELLRLRKQNKQLQLERDILAKATAWFAHHGAIKSE